MEELQFTEGSDEGRVEGVDNNPTEGRGDTVREERCGGSTEERRDDSMKIMKTMMQAMLEDRRRSS